MRNPHSNMIVSFFIPDYNKTISEQSFEGASQNPINGAGIITIYKTASKDYLVTTVGKLNPVTNAYENSLALGGGFNYLNGKANNSFSTAINASIDFKAPNFPKIANDHSDLANSAVLGYCEQWGNMQYATLYRIINVENSEQAVSLIKSVNQQNEQLGKSDRFGLFDLQNVFNCAEITYQMEENNSKKADAVEKSGLKFKNYIDNSTITRFVVFDDMAGYGLKVFIFNQNNIADNLTSLGTFSMPVNTTVNNDEKNKKNPESKGLSNN